MSEANPVDRKQFPLGRALFTTGLVLLLLVIVSAFARIYTGTRASLGEITSPAPVQIDLPEGDFILTRPAGPGDDDDLAVTLDAAAGAFTPDGNDRWVSFGNQRYRVLGTITTPSAGTRTLTVQTGTYPITIRHAQIPLVTRIMKQTAAMGTAAAALTAIGAFIAIRRYNANQREANRAFHELIAEPTDHRPGL